MFAEQNRRLEGRKSARLFCGAGQSNERRCSIEERPQTWHYGLVAKWWSEFNDEATSRQVVYEAERAILA